MSTVTQGPLRSIRERSQFPAGCGTIYLAGIVIFILGMVGEYFSPTPPPLLVYCTHDQELAEPIIRAFEKRSGVRVGVVWDSEATKSLALTERIKTEAKGGARCDVFWNNEVLGMMDLARAGLLEPLPPTENAAPGAFLDPDNRWAAFGARMRVWIVNTNLTAATPEAILTLSFNEPAATCKAKPMFGTTLTHYAVLARDLGLDGLKAWHAERAAAGMKQVSGNGMSKNLVAQGLAKAGWTDTDDFIAAREAGAPVAMVPIRDGQGRAILIPNTVAIMRGEDPRGDAEKFVRFLLSEEVEILLANSPARQIPLRGADPAALPAEVREWRREVENASPLTDLLPTRDAVLAWLRGEP